MASEVAYNARDNGGIVARRTFLTRVGRPLMLTLEQEAKARTLPANEEAGKAATSYFFARGAKGRPL